MPTFVLWMSIRGTSRFSPICTFAYHHFVKKGLGIIETTSVEALHRVNIDGNIESKGNSWQLAFLIWLMPYIAADMLGSGEG